MKSFIYTIKGLCSRFGASKQAYYKHSDDCLEKASHARFIVEYVQSIREIDKAIGGEKLWYMYRGYYIGPTLETAHTLKALKQAFQRLSAATQEVIHHSDRGVQYVISCTLMNSRKKEEKDADIHFRLNISSDKEKGQPLLGLKKESQPKSEFSIKPVNQEQG